MSDLFSDAADRRASEVAPLAQRLRPATLEEFVGQQHVLGEGSALRRAIEEDRVRSLDPLRPAGQRQDDAGADRRGLDRRRVRGAVGGLGDGEGRARGAGAGAGAARHDRAAHDPLPRRDPPLQQGAAGRAAARRRVGARDADRRDDREPVLRGQLRAHLPHAGVRARAADAGGDGGRRPARPCGGRRRGVRRGRGADRAPLGRRRAHGAQHRRARAAQTADGAITRGERRGRRAQAAARLRQGRRPALRLHLGVHQVDARQRSRRGRLLPRRDARGRRGRALHRAADDRARLRGHRQRRPARAARRRRGRAGGRARRPARGAPEPLPGGDLPRARAEVERELRRAEPRDRGRAGARRGAAAEGAARRLVVRAPSSATARATSTRTTTRRASRRATSRRSSRAARTTSRRETARRAPTRTPRRPRCRRRRRSRARASCGRKDPRLVDHDPRALGRAGSRRPRCRRRAARASAQPSSSATSRQDARRAADEVGVVRRSCPITAAVDDPARAEPSGRRRHSGSERDPADRHRLLLDLVAAAPASSGSRDAGAHPEAVVRGVRDRVHLRRMPPRPRAATSPLPARRADTLPW